MSAEMFVLVLALMLVPYLFWGFIKLPDERWQIIASVPRRKKASDLWDGLNLTYYGFFSANAYVIAVMILLVLMKSVGVPLCGILLMMVVMFALCIPASRLVARAVEGKQFTFTVAGAAFIGFIVLLPVVWLINLTAGRIMAFHLPYLPALASAAVAYSLGEGTGRLACISFGCCYGRALADVHPLVRRFFARFNFIFTGKTKKIAYESSLDGQKVLPVQALTALFYTVSGLAGIYLFLKGWFGSAFLLNLVVTQVWRILSEMVRADYRGRGRLSPYQIMSLLSLPYAVALLILLPGSAIQDIDLGQGLRFLWDPVIILILQLLWVAIFVRTGRSNVTGATLSLHVREDSI